MTKCEKLYVYAEEQGIDIFNCSLPNKKSMCFRTPQNSAIAIDSENMENESDELIHVAHEIGHLETNSLYGLSAFCDVAGLLSLQRKMECQATRWAYQTLIPISELKKMLSSEYEISAFEVAEYFGVNTDFLQNTIEYYRVRGHAL